MNKYLISVEADRELSYLFKILMVFTRRRVETININTYRVEDLKVSRFNIQFYADDVMARNISKQIAKQIEVIKADIYLWDDCLHHELGIFSMHKSEKHKRDTLNDIATEHGAVFKEMEEVYIIEKVGARAELDALRDELSTHRLLDFGYSGPTGVLNSKVHKKILI
jgi:acetolactate synthase-1/3 small subunit